MGRPPRHEHYARSQDAEPHAAISAALERKQRLVGPQRGAARGWTAFTVRP